MGDINASSGFNQRIDKESPQLVALLKEMKGGLDSLTSKVQAMTVKVKADQLPTAEGISYLEAKHLLLLNYCQSLVYYLLRKAKGLSIEEHPVVRSLVEIRLFLEKIRPIDKKLEYQIQKFTRNTGSVAEKVGLTEKDLNGTQKSEDLLKYRPNPEMLASRSDMTSEDTGGVYRPPKFAPAFMDEDKVSRLERNALRKEKEMLRQASQSDIMREMVNDLEGRPEEVREFVGTDSREMKKYMAKMEERARQEEEHFTRAPLTKIEKKKMKHLKKSRNGLLGLTESFYDEIKAIPLEDTGAEQPIGLDYRNTSSRKLKKRKGKY